MNLRIDENLADWREISGETWGSLLLGNGFSINVWDRFGYGALYELAKSEVLAHRLNENSIALFRQVGEGNFEDVLRILFCAKLVDEQLGNPQVREISGLYENTKNALAAAVNFVHVPYGLANVGKINQELRRFSNIFSTNYDLLPYWAIMHEVRWFVDYFWQSGSFFDISDTAVYENRVRVYYLHGAIHLVEHADGQTQKLSSNGIGSLLDLFDLAADSEFPLFVSEGNWKQKLSRIRRNDYLRFCFESFEKIEGGLVVLGQSLNENYDQHIINAIRSSPLSKVAVGVWPYQDPRAILAFKARVLKEISGKELLFFSSETHPLGSADLHVEI